MNFFADDLSQLDDGSNSLYSAATDDSDARQSLKPVIPSLCIYFTILSTFYNDEPSIPQVIFGYLKEHRHIAAEFEWGALLYYRTTSFNRCIEAMRDYQDFSVWGAPDIKLMSLYVLADGDNTAGSDVYSLSDNQTLSPIREHAEEEYASPLSSNMSVPERELIVILRRTLDTCVADWDDLQFVSYMQYTIYDHIDLSNLPVGNPGEAFGALENVCIEYCVNAGDINQTISLSDIAEKFLSYYEDEDYPYLSVMRYKDHCAAMDKAWKRGLAAQPAEKHWTRNSSPENRWTTRDGLPVQRWATFVRSWLKCQVKGLRPQTTRARNLLAVFLRCNSHNRSMDSLDSFCTLDSDATLKVTQDIFRRKSITSYKTPV